MLFLAIYLIGRLFLRTGILSFLNLMVDIEWYEYFWMGLAVVFAILQIWSIFLPVNIYALIFVAVLACISTALLLQKGIKLPKINLKFLICTGLILFVISYFASLSGGWPDTYGYHLSAVKWINTYKTVPGLANLYRPLGYSVSFFPFASMIDNLFLKDRSSHIALSLMASVLSIEFLWISLRSKSNYIKIFILLSLPIFVENIAHSVQVSSLSYDFALLITVLAICIELIKGDKKSIFIATVLSIMLVTIKLSGAVFALVVVIFTAYKLVLRKPEFLRRALSFCLIGFCLLVPYIVRNIILSGWPLYPLPIFGLNVPWAVPYDRVVGVFEVIRAWAILPGIHWPNAVGMSFMQWFPNWFLSRSGTIEIRIFFLTLVFILGSVFLKVINKKIIKNNDGLVICGLASLAGILYLIFSAPDFRFGEIFFWVFFASAGSFFFVGIFKRIPWLEKLLVISSVFLIIYVSWPPRLDSRIMLKSIRWDQPGNTYQVLINPSDGSPSFKVYAPTDDSSCGNVQLPCTSEPFNNFKEIIPGNVFGGFAPVK